MLTYVNRYICTSLFLSISLLQTCYAEDSEAASINASHTEQNGKQIRSEIAVEISNDEGLPTHEGGIKENLLKLVNTIRREVDNIRIQEGSGRRSSKSLITSPVLIKVLEFLADFSNAGLLDLLNQLSYVLYIVPEIPRVVSRALKTLWKALQREWERESNGGAWSYPDTSFWRRFEVVRVHYESYLAVSRMVSEARRSVPIFGRLFHYYYSWIPWSFKKWSDGSEAIETYLASMKY